MSQVFPFPYIGDQMDLAFQGFCERGRFTQQSRKGKMNKEDRICAHFISKPGRRARRHPVFGDSTLWRRQRVSALAKLA